MDTLLAVLAALGACSVFVALALLILSPMTARNMVTVWQIRGAVPELEYRVRLYLLLQKLGLVSFRLVLVDSGLSPDARKRAELLCRDESMTDLVSACDLSTYFDFVRVE